MKIIAFGVRPDELKAFEYFSKLFKVELQLEKDMLSKENIDIVKGFDGISVVGKCKLCKETLDMIKNLNIKYITSRTVGYDNVDVKYAKEIGLRFTNASYSPSSVGEFTVMSILNLLRKLPLAKEKMASNDFTLRGIQGRELKSQTVGVIGTGKIGQNVMESLSGFKCKMIAYDPYPNDKVKEIAEYVSFDELISEADVITLHLPLTKDNHHMFNKNVFQKLKDNAIIINNARGALINTQDLIEALNENIIGGAALDVIEREHEFYRADFSDKEMNYKELVELRSMPNVQLTAHHAFFTEQAISDMIECSLGKLKAFFTNQKVEDALC